MSFEDFVTHISEHNSPYSRGTFFGRRTESTAYDFQGNIPAVQPCYLAEFTGTCDADGYFICAMIISTYIDWIMKKNPNEFREIEFIGLDNKFY